MMALHRWREGYKEERTACINRIRGLLAEFGCDERIARHARSDEQAKAAAKLCGIGPVTASALLTCRACHLSPGIGGLLSIA